MPKIRETFDSRQLKGDPPNEATFRFWIIDCQDEEQAAGLVYTLAPLTYRDLVQDRPNLTLAKLGHDAFTAELPYIAPPVPEFPGGGGGGGEDPDGSISEFDTTGGTQHITQCIEQVDYGGEAAAPNIRLSRVVGLTRDGVDGVDVTIPKLEFGITKKYPFDGSNGTITSLFIKNLARLTGKVNQLQFAVGLATYAPGELLFLGARGREVLEDDVWKWEITYMFSASENRQNIVISPTITVAAKKGHEYLWVLYKKDTADNEFVEVPDVAFVSKVYEEADFSATFGGFLL